MALGLDRKSFIDILSEGQFTIGGAMMPPPEGVWGMPPDMLKTLPGYDPDVGKNRSHARALMEKLGYGPDRRLKVKVAARNIAALRDPAVILVDQLKEIYINGELDIVETANWWSKLARKDFQIGFIFIPGGVDIPTSNFMRTTLVVRTATTRATATARSRSCSTSNRWKGTRRSANSWSGKSIGNCRRMGRGRSSITPVSRPAGGPV
jgi:ABC-type transport system substrate-binding protein